MIITGNLIQPHCHQEKVPSYSRIRLSFFFSLSLVNKTLLTLESLLQHQGIGSRKQCRHLIQEGFVQINHQRCLEPKSQWNPREIELTIDETPWHYREHIYLVLHKPAGYECSRSPQHHPSVFTLLPDHFLRRNVQPVGRLDQDTTGLLLLTDQGNWAHTLMSPKHHIEKEYRIQTKHPITSTQLDKLCQGVQLKDQALPSLPLKCIQIDTSTLHLTINEGQYHQVKRMIAAAGNRVQTLHRLRIGSFNLPSNLLEGQWKDLTIEELKTIC
jgi:16S rRNA pseudouridine516 synthase